MPAPRQSPRTITPFGNYLLDELIAEGGMARVYRARLRGVGGFEKPLVVKQVRPELAKDPRFVEMFVEEAKTLVRLSHPHIVPVYELGVVDGTYFLAMDLVDGATLSAILRDGPLGPALVARLAWQVCDALQHAHERFDLVHRDVTPRNVLVDADGQIRLVDFGIATPAEGVTGDVFGSPGYMSPEQLRAEGLDGRSDLFTLGVVLFECLSGKPAFLKSDRDASRDAILAGERPELPSTVPDELAELVAQMMSTDRDERPESAAEIGRRLRTWLAVHHPEGAGRELGARAAQAMTPRESSDDGPVTVTSRKVAQQVQTLATSALLDEARKPEEPKTAPLETGPGTQRIEGRRKRIDTPVTMSVDTGGRHSRPDEALPVPAEPVEDDVELPPESAVASGQVEAVEAPNPLWLRALPLLLAVGAGAAVMWVVVRPADPTPDTRPRVIEPEPETVMEAMAAETMEVETPQMTEPVAEMETMIATPPAPRATIEVGAVPFASVTLDRRRIGDTPVRGFRTTPGQHVLVLDHDLGQLRVPLDVEAGERIQINANFYATPPTYRVRRR